MAEEYFLEDFKNLLDNARTHAAGNNIRAANSAIRRLVEAYKAIGVNKNDAITYIRGGMQDGIPRFPKGFKFPDPVNTNPFRGTANPLEDDPVTKATETKKSPDVKKPAGRTLSMDEVRQRLAARPRGKGLAAPPDDIDEKPKASDKPKSKASKAKAAAEAITDVVDEPLESGKPAGYRQSIENKIKNLERIKDKFPRAKRSIESLKKQLAEFDAKNGSKKVAEAVEKLNFSGLVDRMAKGEVKLSGQADAEFRPTQKVNATNVRFNEPDKLPAVQQTRAALSVDKSEPPRPSSGLKGETRSTNILTRVANDLDTLVKKYGAKAVATVINGAMGVVSRVAGPAGMLASIGTGFDATPTNVGEDEWLAQRSPEELNKMMADALEATRQAPSFTGRDDERGAPIEQQSAEPAPETAPEIIAPAAAVARPSKPAKEPPLRNFSSYELERDIKNDKTGIERAAFIGQVHLPANANLGDVIQYARLSGVESFQWGDTIYDRDPNSPTGFKVRQ